MCGVISGMAGLSATGNVVLAGVGAAVGRLF